MIVRAAIVIVLLGAAVAAERRASGPERSVSRDQLESLPFVIGDWNGAPAEPFPADVVRLLGVDEHINRTYVRGDLALGLYAGYYNSQRRGDTIHSPQNCLPGAGWHPVSSEVLQVDGGRGPVGVNRYVIQKGLQQQVVLYWYHGRGRIVANEYVNKVCLMWDAANLRRTNGGLVRIIAPVTSTTEAATSHAAAFAATLLPFLEKVMP